MAERAPSLLREGMAVWRRDAVRYLGLSLLAHGPLFAFLGLRGVQHATLASQDLRATAVLAVCLAGATTVLALGAVTEAAAGSLARTASSALGSVGTAAARLWLPLAGLFAATGLLRIGVGNDWPDPASVLLLSLLLLVPVAGGVPAMVLGRPRENVRAKTPRARHGIPIATAVFFAVLAAALWTVHALATPHFERRPRPDGSSDVIRLLPEPTADVWIILLLQILVAPVFGVLDAVTHVRRTRVDEDLGDVFE